mmetsp:Transcript_19242/g.41413  ORF Transcript_19242/g.41413 Transcript_19242/m.41413 type:complete len:264 (-) Transcript_19242:166-957(-)
MERRKELLQLMPYRPTPPEQNANGKGKPKRKQRTRKNLGVVLGELESQLFHGAHSGEREFCEDALERGVEVNVRTNADTDGIGTGATALHIAASRGHEAVVKALLRAGADANMASGRGDSPVQLATRAGHVAVVGLLSGISSATQNAQGTAQLLDAAPAWSSDRRKRMLRTALDPARTTGPQGKASLQSQPKGRGRGKGFRHDDGGEEEQGRPKRRGVWAAPSEEPQAQEDWQLRSRRGEGGSGGGSGSLLAAAGCAGDGFRR